MADPAPAVPPNPTSRIDDAPLRAKLQNFLDGINRRHSVLLNMPMGAFAGYSSHSASFSQRVFFAAHRNPYRSLQIPILLLSRSPVAIIWRVAEVIIAPLNRMFWRWFRPHICEEPSIVAPAVADRNAAPPVAIPSLLIGISASLDHGFPTVVLSSVAIACCMPMLLNSISPETATAFGASVHQSAGPDNAMGPTIAKASVLDGPCGGPPIIFKDKKASVSNTHLAIKDCHIAIVTDGGVSRERRIACG